MQDIIGDGTIHSVDMDTGMDTAGTDGMAVIMDMVVFTLRIMEEEDSTLLMHGTAVTTEGTELTTDHIIEILDIIVAVELELVV